MEASIGNLDAAKNRNNDKERRQRQDIKTATGGKTHFYRFFLSTINGILFIARECLLNLRPRDFSPLSSAVSARLFHPLDLLPLLVIHLERVCIAPDLCGRQ
jgi:hypothetical protein